MDVIIGELGGGTPFGPISFGIVPVCWRHWISFRMDVNHDLPPCFEPRMTTAKYQRFTNLRVLKSIHHNRLLKFLSPYANYIATRGLTLPQEGKLTDQQFELLGEILRFPDHLTPSDLLQSIHMVNELARESMMETLLVQIEELTDAFDQEQRIMPADVAVEAILRHREHAETIHRSHALSARRTYSYFQANSDESPILQEPIELSRVSFENLVGSYFESKQCGRGTRVGMHLSDDVLDLMVSHGLPWQLQDVLVDGARDILSFQPLHEDLLQFNRLTGELKINAVTAIQKEMYRSTFGRAFFGKENLFPPGDIWTTEPLRRNGEAALSVINVPQLLSATLTCATLFIAGAKPELVTTKRSDLIEILDERIAYFENMDIDVRIAEARIELRFVEGRRTRSVAIKPPNMAVYTRDGDADVIELFLMDRGYSSGKDIERFALAPAPLARSSVGA
jgi:hypothetical protein